MSQPWEGVTLEPLYYVGLDLGQKRDYSAIVVLEQQVFFAPGLLAAGYTWAGVDEGWNSPGAVYAVSGRWPLEHVLERDEHRWPSKPPMLARHLERMRGEPYPAVVAHVAKLMGALPPLGVTLVVDATGVGAPVVDLLRQAGLFPVPVIITGGESVSRDRGTWHVPKRELVGAVQAGLQTDRLKIAPESPLAGVLVAELDAFRVTIDARTRHDSYAAWRERDHDDLVLATALPLWLRDRVWKNYDHDRLTRETPADTYASAPAMRRG